MRNVAIGHEEILVADSSDTSAAKGPDMQGGELSNLVVVADHELGIFARVFQILRDGADRRRVKDPVSLADRGIAIDHRMSPDPRSGADSYFGPYDRVGSHLDCRME